MCGNPFAVRERSAVCSGNQAATRLGNGRVSSDDDVRVAVIGGRRVTHLIRNSLGTSVKDGMKQKDDPRGTPRGLRSRGIWRQSIALRLAPLN